MRFPEVLQQIKKLEERQRLLLKEIDVLRDEIIRVFPPAKELFHVKREDDGRP